MSLTTPTFFSIAKRPQQALTIVSLDAERRGSGLWVSGHIIIAQETSSKVRDLVENTTHVKTLLASEDLEGDWLTIRLQV